MIITFLFILSFNLYASSEEIEVLLEKKLNDRVSIYSSYFLGKTVVLGPLGEGDSGQFDQDPLFSFNYFDCTTFVETILALVQSKDLKDFYQQILRIRYLNGEVSFYKRNHFISIDWIPYLNQLNLIQDITSKIGPVEISKTYINKKGWYENLDYSSLKIQESLSLEDKNKLLATLRSLGRDFTPVLAELPFINILEIFNNPSILERIPDNTIINIVRPNWDLLLKIGTELDISHQGLGIWQHGILIYRHASVDKGTVVDVPILDYLKQYLSLNRTIGINIQLINLN